MLDLAINVPKFYEHPNKKVIPRYLIDLIHDKKIKGNLNSIRKESDF